MESTMNLLPSESPQVLVEVEGGSYFDWNDTVFPILEQANVSAGYLIMNPRGFALPHFSDGNRIAYAFEGTEGVVGFITPGSNKEKVVNLKKGDAIFVPNGGVSWWFNAGNDKLKVIFLGETYNAINPGTVSYGLLAGAIGVLNGFSAETISKAYALSEEQANELTTSQKEPLITRIAEDKIMPKPSKHEHLTINFEQTSPDINVKNGGFITSLTPEKYPILEGSRLCGKLLRLEPNAMFRPSYCATDSGVELTYVTKGSGWVQVVGMNGQLALDAKLEADQLFVVPKYYVVAIGAGEEGIECFSTVNTSKAVFSEVAGKKSFWNSISPEVVQVSLNVSPEFGKLFVQNVNKTTIITPPN